MARAFDLIEREYGWTDETVLELTLRRMRQIQSAIFQRKYIEDRQRRGELSWQTRMLGQIIAHANTQPSKDGKNPLAEVAAGLDMDNPNQGSTGKSEAATRPAPVAQNGEPKRGSFEAIMAQFGGKMDGPQPQ